jgi:polysaccharide export outer membrane protein
MTGLARMLLVGLVLVSPVGLRLALGAALVPPQDDKVSSAPGSQVKGNGPVRDVGDETIIGPNDLLFIQVYDVDQLTREYRVSPNGLLTVPLLQEPVSAAGLTPTQLAQLLTLKFQEAGLLTNPQLTVTIRESRVHAVTIAGAVRKPQIYPIQGRTTLLDVLSQAEGVMDDAGSTATITRGEAALRSLGLTTEKDLESSQSLIPATVTVNLKRLLETGDPSLNVEVFPGDRVTVPRAGIVYVVGAVTRSGGFPMTSAREEMTVLKALALAGDVTSTAKKKKAMIIRKTPALPGGREEIPVDLNAVLAGSSPDRALQANDILFVPDSGSKRALRRAADAAVQVGTGVVIYRR